MSNTLLYGFRGREYPVEKPKGTFRILVIGDSLVYGQGVAPTESVPAQMERLLNHSRGDQFYHVLNISKCGYGMADYLPLFTEVAEGFKPDAVVLSMCHNDAEMVNWQLEHESPEEYFHAIWDEDAPSWPFFRKAFENLLASMPSIPLLLAFYSRGDDQAIQRALPALNKVCRENKVGFLNLVEKIEWIPTNMAMASPDDPHPSVLAHRVAAVEICKELMALKHLPAEDRDDGGYRPDLAVEGVSPEWQVEELRAWCSYRRDSESRKEVSCFLDNDWGPIASEIYGMRQIRVMESWWSRLKFQGAFDWAAYKIEIIRLKKEIEVLRLNAEQKFDRYLNSITNPPVYISDDITFEKVEALIHALKQPGVESLSFGSELLNMSGWVLAELQRLRVACDSINVPEDSFLGEAKHRTWKSWKRIANRFIEEMDSLLWDRFMHGIQNPPLAVDKPPGLEFRVGIMTDDAAIKQGNPVLYLQVNLTGHGANAFSMQELAITGLPEQEKLFCFRFPLPDLFVAEVKYLSGIITRIEYRSNEGEWINLPVPMCENIINRQRVKTLLLPAFI